MNLPIITLLHIILHSNDLLSFYSAKKLIDRVNVRNCCLMIYLLSEIYVQM